MFPQRFFPGTYYTGDYFPKVGAEPPPPPPPPSPDEGDAAALIGFGHVLPGDGPRRYYWRKLADPWERIRALQRKLDGQPIPGDGTWQDEPVRKPRDPERELEQMVTVGRISRMARRKR